MMHRSFPYTQQTFGRGGGMSVFFRGYAAGNTVEIIGTNFIGNNAVWGGGLFVEFNHYASINTVSVKENQSSLTMSAVMMKTLIILEEVGYR